MALILSESLKSGNDHSAYDVLDQAPQTESHVEVAEISSVLLAQKPLANEALKTFDKIFKNRNIVGTAIMLPQLVSLDAFHDAKGRLEDSGALWRSQTNAVAINIATELPDRLLGSIGMASGNFYSKARRLYSEDNGVISVYYETPPPKSDPGTQRADEEQWLDFLFRITLLHKPLD